MQRQRGGGKPRAFHPGPREQARDYVNDENEGGVHKAYGYKFYKQNKTVLSMDVS